MTAGTYSYQDAFTSIEARGRVKGEAKMLLRMLDARGLVMSDELRARVMSCGDTAQLEAWFDRAVNATTVDEVFGDE